jgi:hypothetical protein
VRGWLWGYLLLCYIDTIANVFNSVGVGFGKGLDEWMGVQQIAGP